jgi:hypothetical protein
MQSDPYGVAYMQTSAIKKEISRLRKLASVHHHRGEVCDQLKCKNPYQPILDAMSRELQARGKDKKALDKLSAMWARVKRKLTF